MNLKSTVSNTVNMPEVYGLPAFSKMFYFHCHWEFILGGLLCKTVHRSWGLTNKFYVDGL